VKRRQRTHAASGGASEALPHEVGARPSRSEPKLNTHALYPSRSELRGITFKNKAGWYPARQTGSHLIMIKQGSMVTLSVPMHSEIDRGTLRKLIGLAGLSVEEFLELL